MSMTSARISLINWNSLLVDKMTSFVISQGFCLGHDRNAQYRIVMSSLVCLLVLQGPQFLPTHHVTPSHLGISSIRLIYSSCSRRKILYAGSGSPLPQNHEDKGESRPINDLSDWVWKQARTRWKDWWTEWPGGLWWYKLNRRFDEEIRFLDFVRNWACYSGFKTAGSFDTADRIQQQCWGLPGCVTNIEVRNCLLSGIETPADDRCRPIESILKLVAAAPIIVSKQRPLYIFRNFLAVPSDRSISACFDRGPTLGWMRNMWMPSPAR